MTSPKSTKRNLNRTVIGIISIALALVLVFIVSPLITRQMNGRTEIVRMKRNVQEGYIIEEDDLEIITVGAYNLPADIIKDKSKVTGKFAACDLKAGDYLFPSKVKDKSDGAHDVLNRLGDNEYAVTVTISNFANGFSGELLNGDIVKLTFFDSNKKTVSTPGTLQYLKVITTVTGSGINRDELHANEDGTYETPVTVMFLCNDIQAKQLILLQNTGGFHCIFVCRGDNENACKYLKIQEDYFVELEKRLAEMEENGDNTGHNDNTGEYSGDDSFGDGDIFSEARDIIAGKKTI